MHRTIHHLGRAAALNLLLVACVGAGTVAAAPAPTASGPDAAPAASGRCLEAWTAAHDTPTVDELRELGFCEIDRRLETLEKLQAAIDRAQALTDDHEAALEKIITATTAGLRDLRAEIAADTALAELRDDLRRVVTDFRVYVLVARQVWLVIGDDRAAAGVAKAATAAGRVEEAVAAAEAAGKDTAASRAHVAALTSAITAAKAAIEGDAAAVLAQTPTGWNAGQAKPILDAARSSLTDARAQLKTAVREARSAIADLR